MKHFSLLGLLIAYTAMTASAATTYCGEQITSGGENRPVHTADITCQSLGNNMYRFIFESTDAFTGYNAAGSNFYMNVNGVGGYHVSEYLTQDGNTLTAVIESTVVPTFYAGDFFVNYSDGEALYNIPTDADFSQTCGYVGEDTEAPVMGTATVQSVTHNAVTIAVSATPADEIASFVVKNGDTELGSFTPADGVITVTGLSVNTAYTLSVYAKKITGLLSENFATVSFTTENLTYCDFPTGHQGDANFGDANGRILLTLKQTTANKVQVTVKPNTENGATKLLDYLYVAPSGAKAATYIAGTDITDGDGETSMSVEVEYEALPATMNFHIEWSHPAWDGRWALDLNGVTAETLCSDKTTTMPAAATPVKNVQKRIKNGMLIIYRDNKAYSVLGTAL
ncbi:MAG: hypothetical protein ACI4BD_02700 [Paludibacteraceae bacterium]